MSFGRIPAAPAPREAYLLWSRSRTHQARVAKARDILRAAADVGPVVVSMSWGKDSTAMGDLALDTLGAVQLCNMPGTRDLPGGEAVRAHFAARTTIHEIPRDGSMDHLAWCRLVGLAHERDAKTQSRVVAQQKRVPGSAWAASQGYRVQAIGLRAEESKIRRGLLLDRGAVYTRVDGVTVCCPLAWWTAQDVWAWIFARALPYHPLYDCETHGETRETLRNGGWLATDGAERGRIAWLRAHYPAEYRELTRLFPRVGHLG